MQFVNKHRGTRNPSILLLLAFTSLGVAQTGYKDIHDFGSTVLNLGGAKTQDGKTPLAAGTFRIDGLYPVGATSQGGKFGKGMIWYMYTDAAGHAQYRDIHDFGGTVIFSDGTSGNDGANPMGEVCLNYNHTSGASSWYGITNEGGEYSGDTGGGVLWHVTSSGQYEVLHSFGLTVGASGFTDGNQPYAGLAIDAGGNIFGTTSFGSGQGELNEGTVWMFPPSGEKGYKILFEFAGGDYGDHPIGEIAVDKLGNVYGAASGGGDMTNYPGGAGVIWKIATRNNNLVTILHTFEGTDDDGGAPTGVTMDPEGNLYGTTQIGSSPDSDSLGTVWKIDTHGVYSVLHVFSKAQDILHLVSGHQSSDGLVPYGRVTIDNAGNLYGTTLHGGINDSGDSGGTLWTITKAGIYAVVHDFGGQVKTSSGKTGNDGDGAASSVSCGIVTSLKTPTYLMGTAYAGGANGDGMTWTLTPNPQRIVVTPSTIPGGTTTTATLWLNAPAYKGGVAVTLKSNSTYAVVPSGVVVPAGGLSATFTIKTVATATSRTATISATGYTDSTTEAITIAPPKITGLGLKPSTVEGGASSTGTVTIGVPAPTGGTNVKLVSSSTKATVPASVLIPAGKTTAPFTVKTSSVTSTQTAFIIASDGTSSMTQTLTITTSVATVSISPSSVIGGTASKGTVTLTGPAPTGGAKIALASNAEFVSLPTSVAIAAGATSATFNVTSSPVATNSTAKITATLGTFATASLTVQAPALVSLTVSPASVKGSSTTIVTGTVTLTGPAPTGGTVVSLKSSNTTAATVSATVKVAAGSTKATFTVGHSKVTANVTVTLTATFAGTNKTVTLTVTP